MFASWNRAGQWLAETARPEFGKLF
jgi:hypothetical protein